MSNELELRDYFLIIKKRVWLIVGFVMLVTIVSGVYSKFFKEPIYEASTKIIVNRSAEVNNGVQQLNSEEVNTNIRMINTYKEIIKTPAILDKVVEQHPEFGQTAEQLMEKVAVSSVNDTQVMTVVVRDDSYKLAAEIANAVSETFKQEIPGLFNVQNVSILNKAKIDNINEPKPVSPNAKLNVLIAFIVSLVIAIGITFLIEYLDDTIKTEQDVERYLELPTLAMISKVDMKETRENYKTSITSSKAGELSHVTTRK
ncbi:lipopolysaccharide biosynthesis protein [Cohnella xylanilytica]|uniref:Lipopolysaccharide biosynthesis protein n=1 Tax=Cohnella xylanilytica TaxID=557555 RepID=A0A841TYF3_9BACL|nr:Wzz/FepE/Etk N-terminal domain-containing protein [Cohnella xylanilytica]MBB6693255.1 lipopolysaccharide biosynthesis protein [Cohnella xylanilytica]